MAASGATTAAAEPATAHAPPVDAPVADPFRLPGGPYGAGNRGLDYDTEAGGDVRATAPGEVTFAGQVGGTRHVVVLHDDGLRTSYSFLEAIAVARGQAVGRGDVLGTSAERFHLGLRAGDRYVDPALLFVEGPVEVRLVPDRDARAVESPAEERRGLLTGLLGAAAPAVSSARWLAGRGAAVGRLASGAGLGAALAGDEGARSAARWLGDRSAGLGRLVAGGPGIAQATLGAAAVLRLAVARPAAALAAALAARARRQVLAPVLAVGAVRAARRTYAELRADQTGCTPPSEPPPPPPSGRRIAVLVAGYGSTGGDAEVLDVDTTALGYAPDDRVQLSYAGGRVPGVGSLGGVPTSPYGPADSMVDLATSGRHLRRLLEGIGAAHPGVPVDLVAHSQGGLVARTALTGPGAEDLPVERLVTLGTPHGGAPAATLAVQLGLDDPASRLGDGLASASGGGVDPGAPSVRQMAEGSPELRRLAARPLPPTLAVTSIAAAGDVVVPALSSTLVGAPVNAVVTLGGPTAHGWLPGSPEAMRELALALAGRGPTCATVVTHAAAVATSAAVTVAELGLGGALAPTVLTADALLSLAR